MLGGVVFAGVCSSFAFMLAERGEGASTISNILSATVVYGLKFAISPFVKNWFVRYADEDDFSYIKWALCGLQFVILILMSSLGLFANGGDTWLAWITVFTLIVIISPIDVACAHIKLIAFKRESLGFTTSIENIGFRVGLFISGAFTLYIASTVGWRTSFLITCIIPVVLSSLSTIFMRKIKYVEYTEFGPTSSVKDIAIFLWNFLKEHRTFLIAIVIISFKFSDSCINALKSVFLYSIGVDKVTFANISHSIGIIATITGSCIAGVILAKKGVGECIRLSLILQGVASVLFLFLANFKVDMVCIAILINISTLIFGFSCIILRTYLAEESQKDANIYISFLSIGSLLRTVSCNIGGFIADNFSWENMYILCIMSVVPGLYICAKYPIKK
jgi:PAT family beta-lactamase induction signal transducer AmpG